MVLGVHKIHKSQKMRQNSMTGKLPGFHHTVVATTGCPTPVVGFGVLGAVYGGIRHLRSIHRMRNLNVRIHNTDGKRAMNRAPHLLRKGVRERTASPAGGRPSGNPSFRRHNMGLTSHPLSRITLAMLRRESISDSVKRVTATPCRPARPVRPIRWM